MSQLADSQALAVKTLYQLQPLKNKEEFEHYRLMADIRMLYLTYQKIEAEVNDSSCNNSKVSSILMQLEKLLSDSKVIDQRFISLNKNTLYVSELQEENNLRNSKIILLYQRLAKEKMGKIFALFEVSSVFYKIKGFALSVCLWIRCSNNCGEPKQLCPENYKVELLKE